MLLHQNQSLILGLKRHHICHDLQNWRGKEQARNLHTETRPQISSFWTWMRWGVPGRGGYWGRGKGCNFVWFAELDFKSWVGILINGLAIFIDVTHCYGLIAGHCRFINCSGNSPQFYPPPPPPPIEESLQNTFPLHHKVAKWYYE